MNVAAPIKNVCLSGCRKKKKQDLSFNSNSNKVKCIPVPPLRKQLQHDCVQINCATLTTPGSKEEMEEKLRKKWESWILKQYGAFLLMTQSDTERVLYASHRKEKKKNISLKLCSCRTTQSV